MTPKQILQIFGLKKATETINPGELRNMFAHYSKHSWYSLMADVRKVTLPKGEEPLENIREHLLKLKPLRSR